MVLDTTNFTDVALDNLKKVIGRVDVLTVNDEQARHLTATLFAASRRGHSCHGPKTVVIKKGEHGALVPPRRGLLAPVTHLTRWLTPPGRETPLLEGSWGTWRHALQPQGQPRGKT